MELPADLTVNFSAEGLKILYGILGFIMFGIALELTPKHFKILLEEPRAFLAGFTAQWLLLPLFTYAFVRLAEVPYHLALGMILVAACPSGNVSNFMTYMAGGNTALSIVFTAMVTLLSAFTTPFNFHFYSSMLSQASGETGTINIDFLEMLKNLLVLTILPITAGILVRYRYPEKAMRISGFFQKISFAFLLLFIALAFISNRDVLLRYAPVSLFYVVIHNALALCIGYGVARLFRLSVPNLRSIVMETGIHNSGMGLVLIYAFFGGNGQMALIAVTWGLWHLISGSLAARALKRFT